MLQYNSLLVGDSSIRGGKAIVHKIKMALIKKHDKRNIKLLLDNLNNYE